MNKAYAVAHLQNVRIGPAIVEYLEKIDATLGPFDGHFIIHGETIEVAEGPFDGNLIVIEFPSEAEARGWYESDAYQAILPLRTENADGWAILAAGVGRDHRATDVLEAAA